MRCRGEMIRPGSAHKHDSGERDNKISSFPRIALRIPEGRRESRVMAPSLDPRLRGGDKLSWI